MKEVAEAILLTHQMDVGWQEAEAETDPVAANDPFQGGTIRSPPLFVTRTCRIMFR